MNGSPSSSDTLDLAARGAFWLGLGLVIVGMANNIPTVPGLDQLAVRLTGDPTIAIRKFSYYYIHPLVFLWMMLIVALHHSFARGKTGAARLFGLGMDVALVVMAVAIALTYLVEIRSICLVDQFTGERAELLARSLREEREFARLYGLPIPDSVEDPQCLNTTGAWLFAIVGAAIAVFLAYNIKVWSFPLVLVALVIAGYTILTVLVWYFWGAEDINKYLMTKLGGEPRHLISGRPKVHDILVNTGSSLLGQFMNILLNTVFPYVVLGGLFGASGGGRSMIKLAFRWTRHLRGGPAHAAIVSSALFGTISGGPVVNVLSTGVLTIPMMVRRGFNRVFAGGVEAAASSGGQVMPPVMGVAAFVLASLTLVPYREVIIAAFIPAVAYFGCLFLTVVFQARKQGLQALGEITEEMILDQQDKLNLAMVFGPILLILVLLLTPKEAVGCGFLAGLLGVDQSADCTAAQLPWVMELFRNSAGDAGAAGWWAVIFLSGLLFLDPEVRARPGKVVDALARSGILMSTLYLMFLAVSVIDFCLNFTGLSVFVAQDILSWLRGLDISATGAPAFMLLALLVTMLLAVLLGMGMPTVPAYINVALLMGPMLAGLGIATFTAHMFIFYFAVASAITPPVAIAAFAASTITKAEPMATGFSAVRSGIVMFTIPFVFALYPELLLVEQALIDPNSTTGARLPGYENAVSIPALAWLLLRVVLALYLVASALSRFDRQALGSIWVGTRLMLAVAVLARPEMVHGAGIAAALALLAWHRLAARRVNIEHRN